MASVAVTFRMRPASKTCRRPEACRRLRPQIILRACLPKCSRRHPQRRRALCSSSASNTQRIWARRGVERAGPEALSASAYNLPPIQKTDEKQVHPKTEIHLARIVRIWLK
jgi:hypothetical protein